jgi:hypothetical protein
MSEIAVSGITDQTETLNEVGRRKHSVYTCQCESDKHPERCGKGLQGSNRYNSYCRNPCVSNLAVAVDNHRLISLIVVLLTFCSPIGLVYEL